uniref:Uncharacterized protein, isoform A n=1 Tax=Drosophila melanogaster TaxID=7227 RepID=Q9VR18_DROME|nr:uncharacterized protein Dmel_CG11929, isoform A [Drosophila melanogaster]AAF50990.2 uncharacterized protein Dmel_CG11929, isoform A [Drosophila melanogaster]|eukprot:NP_608849.1 uncharacterized protein Dmel_CG11929, isoform A [Drosophila melanogaster]
MSAPNKEIVKGSLTAQQIRQKHQYVRLIMLLRRRVYFPRKTKSDYSLTRINFNSTDASMADSLPTGATATRLPAGATCSCRSISGRPKPAAIASESTQTIASTEDMGTQTVFQTDPNEDFDCGQDASTQSMLNMHDVETQSIPVSSKNLNSIQTQTDYEEPKTVRFPLKKYSKTEHEEKRPRKSNTSLRKCFFKRPLIVVKGGALISSDFTANIHQSRMENVSVTTRKEDKETQYENHFGTQSNSSDDQPSDPSTCSKILDRVQKLEAIMKRQELFLRDLQGSVKSWKVQECKPSDCRIIFQGKPEACELPKKLETSDQASQINDIHEERKLPIKPEGFNQSSQKKYTARSEEQKLPIQPEPFNQSSQKKYTARSEEQKLPIKPEPFNQSSQKIYTARSEERKLPRKPENVDQATQKKDTANCECKTLSKEFIQIFLKPETAQEKQKSNNSQRTTDTPINSENSTGLQCSRECNGSSSKDNRRCCKANGYEMHLKGDQFPTAKQCLKDTENFLEQFNRVFAKTKSEETLSDKSRNTSAFSANPTKQNDTEHGVENLLGEIVKKPKSKVSSTSCLEAKSSEQSNKSVEKELYKSFIEQLISHFTKSKSCENNQAQNAQSESYSFDRLLPEFVKMFTRSNSLEEDRPKKVSISEKKTILGANPMTSFNCSKTPHNIKSTALKSELKTSDMELDANGRRGSCQLEGESKPSAIFRNTQRMNNPPRGCQYCGDGSLPILDSLMDEIFRLIGQRPFDDVVLTILRQEDNVYHIKVREMATGKDLGCILGSGRAINQAIGIGLFEDIPTFCELDKNRQYDPRDCPLDELCRRQCGGEIAPDGSADKERVVEFCTRVLGLPAGQASRFFSVTNALKMGNRELTGRGAVTSSLVDNFSSKDLSDVAKTSSLFLRIISGQCNDVQDDE